MQITIIAVGKIKEKYLKEGINEYLKRLRPYAKVEMAALSS
jgi:23S rRNA (pseudouridine1915-N3)-methyltransferase